MSTSMAVSSVRVGGRRLECDGCFFSSRHCRNGSGSVLLISCDGWVGCDGGESVGLLKGNRVDRNEVLF